MTEAWEPTGLVNEPGIDVDETAKQFLQRQPVDEDMPVAVLVNRKMRRAKGHRSGYAQRTYHEGQATRAVAKYLIKQARARGMAK